MEEKKHASIVEMSVGTMVKSVHESWFHDWPNGSLLLKLSKNPLAFQYVLEEICCLQNIDSSLSFEVDEQLVPVVQLDELHLARVIWRLGLIQYGPSLKMIITGKKVAEVAQIIGIDSFKYSIVMSENAEQEMQPVFSFDDECPVDELDCLIGSAGARVFLAWLNRVHTGLASIFQLRLPKEFCEFEAGLEIIANDKAICARLRICMDNEFNKAVLPQEASLLKLTGG